MSYEDIIGAQAKRDIKDAAGPSRQRGGRQRRRGTTRKSDKSLAEELEDSRREIQTLGLERYCLVLQF